MVPGRGRKPANPNSTDTQNAELPAGSLEAPAKDFTIRVARGYATPDQFARMPIVPGRAATQGQASAALGGAAPPLLFAALGMIFGAHPAALLVSHNSFAVFLAEKIFGYAFAKNGSKNRLIAVREVFERVIFLRMKIVFSPFEIVARTASAEWMRGTDAMRSARKEKERLVNVCEIEKSNKTENRTSV